MVSHKRVWCDATVGLFLSAVFVSAACGEVIDLRPVNDTFVVDPGNAPPHSKMIGIEDNDFGGSGAREVAAAAACDSTAAYPNNKPHGYFRTLLRFDPSELSGKTIVATTMNLYVTHAVGTSGKDIFNPRSMSGSFNVSLLALPASLEWTQGYGTPDTITTRVSDPASGLTHNLLEDLLAKPDVSPVDIGTLYFNTGLLDPAAAQTWMSFDLNSQAFNNALSSGNVFTLLLSPADDSVSLRFSGRIQNNYPGDPPTVLNNGPMLSVTVAPEPTALALLTGGLLVGLALRLRWRP